MIDLEAIKTRLAAATPGPWYVDESLRGVEAQAHGYPVEVVAWTGRAEAVLIAAAPADIGALVAEVERLRSINDDYLLEMGRKHALLRGQRHADNEAIAGAWDAGRDNERAAGVAWLREWQNTMDDRITHDDLDYAIAVIERGEHRREENE